MKNLSILLISLTIFFYGCSSNDDDTTTPPNVVQTPESNQIIFSQLFKHTNYIRLIRTQNL